MNTFLINDIEIGRLYEPYLIAEIGVNHECSMELAKRLIDEAHGAGAHAVKFQSYKAEKLASIVSPAYWDLEKEPITTQYSLFKKYDQFGQKEYETLSTYCKTKPIAFLSTPFDKEAVEFLTPIVPAFKIASADITNIPLLRNVAGTGKPLILSTGAASLAEIETAIQTVRAAGAIDIALLHCVLSYPTQEKHAQLSMINVLQRVFPDCLIGYSDHVKPDETISSLEAAMLIGACILEKHFTHDKTLPGNDHYHSMDKHDLKQFVKKMRKFKVMIGNGTKNLKYEHSARKYARRSIFSSKVIIKGEKFSEKNLTVKRPGNGISPLHWDQIIGKIARSNLSADHLILWSDLACDNNFPKSNE
jgi:sialic acid synthase SpsE